MRKAQAHRTDIEGLAEAVRVMASSLAAIAVRIGPLRTKTDPERIHALALLGFDRNETAGILGTTPGTVSVRLSESRAGAGTRRRRRGKG